MSEQRHAVRAFGAALFGLVVGADLAYLNSTGGPFRHSGLAAALFGAVFGVVVAIRVFRVGLRPEWLLLLGLLSLTTVLVALR